MCLIHPSMSNAYLWERTLPPLCGTLPSLMAGHHSKVGTFVFSSPKCICWYPSAHTSVCLCCQAISWRGRRKAPPDGLSSTLMCTNQRRMRPRGWLKESCMRWGCLLSTALACLRPVSPPNPSCLLVGILVASMCCISLVVVRFFKQFLCRLQPRQVNQCAWQCMMWRTAHAAWSGWLQRRSELEAWMVTPLNTARKEVRGTTLLVTSF